jgi:Na+/phosphate symporter
MLIVLSLLVCIIGLLIYALTKDNSKVLEIGRIMFFCGLLVFLFSVGPDIIKLFNR